MNHLSKLTALASFCVLGVSSIQADQTNLVQDLNLRLMGLTQGADRANGTRTVNPTTFGTREVISLLGAATGNTFSRAAELVVITPLPAGTPTFAVRDGANAVDVSSFFTYQQLGGALESSEMNSRTGRSSTVDYSLQRLALRDSASYPALTAHFDVQGIAVQTTTNSPRQGWNTGSEANMAGAGDRNGNALILQGDVTITGNTLEVVSGGGGYNN
jgi:hypothetical protein